MNTELAGNLLPQITPEVEERFWANVEKRGPEECWLWTRAMDSDGYGAFQFGGKQRKTHRLAWEMKKGPIPKGMCVLHRCDNPPCCNPEHLWLGTNLENISDRDAKGRQSKGDNHFSRLRPELLARGEANGSRLHPERLPRGDAHWSRFHPERVASGAKNGAYTHPEKIRRGADHGGAKLTTDDVVKIRQLRAEGFTQLEISKRFKVGRASVSHILNRRAWKHVE